MFSKATGGIRHPLPLTAIGSSACTVRLLYHYPCVNTSGAWGQSHQKQIKF